MRGFVRSIEKVPSEEVSCGKLHLLSTRDDFAEANLVVVEASEEDMLHYHPQATEMYYILSGEGRVRLNGESVEAREGNLIFIPPFTAHSIIPTNSGLEALTISVPAWRPEDECEVGSLILFLGKMYRLAEMCEESKELAGSAPYHEKEAKHELQVALENSSKKQVKKAIKLASEQMEEGKVTRDLIYEIGKSKHGEAILRGLQRTKTEVGVEKFYEGVIKTLKQAVKK